MIGGIMKAYSGKKYGNQIADFLQIHRGLFHTAMEEGGCEMHLLKLYFLKQENLDMAEVAYDSCEYLLQGLLVLETRFGKQPLSEDALEKIKAFRLAHEKSNSDSQTPQAKSTNGPLSNDERQSLIDAFRESAALSSWILIRVIESNSAFFETTPDLFENTQKLFEAGMSHSEQSNERMANNCFSHAIKTIFEQHAELFQGDPKFDEAFTRLQKLQDEVITPLWNKYAAEESLSKSELGETKPAVPEASEQDSDDDFIRGSGRYQLRYKIEVVQKLRGKEFVSEEVSGLRSDNLDGLKSMAFMHNLAGKEVELKDLATGQVIEVD